MVPALSVGRIMSALQPCSCWSNQHRRHICGTVHSGLISNLISCLPLILDSSIQGCWQYHCLHATKKLTDRLLEWLVPLQARTAAVFWRPAALACVPLVLGMAVGNQLDIFSDVYTTDFYSVDMEETELELISLADYSESLQ